MRPVVILGMHRSGTSCLAGCLEEAGLNLGEVVTGASYNLKGNRENLAIRALNERVLEANGGSWDAPPTEATWSDQHRVLRDQILTAQPPGGCRWGFKDPRTLLTISGWLEALPSALLVGSFRHPLSVAASLAARDGLATEVSLDLWRTYNERLLGLTENGLRLVSFDLAATEYRAAVGRLIPHLGLTTSESPSFFERGLRNHRDCSAEPVPVTLRQIYERLTEVSRRPFP